ncbi:MAG: DGQHR domain-containing protein [Candidatus Falkowbacteria bacterium]
MKYHKIKIIKINQNIGSFFVGKLTPKILHLIANKKLARVKDPIFGIQREIKDSKILEIKDYLKRNDATLPNTIIIAIQSDPSDEDPVYKIDNESCNLSLLLKEGIANILDGQHRLMGFGIENDEFELPVSIYLDLSLEEQAKIFAKINSTQTKVDLNLVYDLYGITKERTTEKVAFHIVKHLAVENESAWKDKIKTLTDKSGDLAQGSMAKYFHKQLLEKDKIFIKLYESERDTDIKNIISNYFNAIKNVFPVEWENKDNLYILTKTTGFNGFMNFFITLVHLADFNKYELSVDYFKEYILKVKGQFEQLTSENYESGGRGQNKIKDILRKSLTEDEAKMLKIKKY